MLACVASLAFAAATPARALDIVPTFDSSVTAPERTAIDAAINILDTDVVTSVTASIYFDTMTGALSENVGSFYTSDYFDYYTALKAIDDGPGSTAAQQSAFASLGTPPTSSSSGNPVNGSTQITITTPDARALGFTGPLTDGNVPVGGLDYDGEVLFNPASTSPPDTLSGNYSLETAALHEIDEVLGIGGNGSTLYCGASLTGAVGPLDLFRYSAPGVRSFTTSSTNQPYFSANGGTTAVSYFEQVCGADFGDWQSDPDHAGFGPQVQDAFATSGANTLPGPNEFAALNVIGYDLAAVNAPEPGTLSLLAAAFAGLAALRRRRSLPLR